MCTVRWDTGYTDCSDFDCITNHKFPIMETSDLNRNEIHCTTTS